MTPTEKLQALFDSGLDFHLHARCGLVINWGTPDWDGKCASVEAAIEAIWINANVEHPNAKCFKKARGKKK